MILQFFISNFFAIVFVIDFVVLMRLIYENRDPADTAFWTLTIILVPYLGVVAFFFFGRDWRRGTRKSRRELPKYEVPAKKFFPAFFKNYDSFDKSFYRKYENEWISRIASLTRKVNQSPIFPAEEVRILPSGQLAFDALKTDLKDAKKSIHLAFFIWEKDKLTAELVEILLGKLKEGVEVRVAYDFLGSLTYGKKELKLLKKAGAKVFPDVTEINRFNYRNHRKIAVIDGTIGYTGGINVGQEYIDGGKHYPSWRDTFVRVTGPVVSELQRLFSTRWNIVSDENIILEKYFPVQKYDDNDIAVQLNFSSSEIYWEAARDAYLQAILNAKDRVYIMSPYFVPDQVLFAALETAALSGVDVRLIMTGWPDKKIAWWAAQTFFERLLHAGMKIYYYEAGFYHTKTLAVDDNFVSIGTTNFDVRSFTLQKENTLFIYDEKVVAEHFGIFADDLTKCREFTLDDYSKLTTAKKFRNAVCKLLSNLF